MTLGIIAYHFSESSLPLAKYLAKKGHKIKYYFILKYNSSREIPAMNIYSSFLHWGVNKLRYNNAPETYTYFEGLDVELYILYLPPKIYKSKLIRNIYFYFQKKYFKYENFQYLNIIGHDNLLVYYSEIFKNINVVHSLHEVNNHSIQISEPSTLLKYLFLNKKNIIVHSEISYKRIIEYNECDLNNVSVIPFGLFETYLMYNAESFKFNKEFVLFYGNFLAYKGIDVFLEAIVYLNKINSNIDFVIAGNGFISELDQIEKIDNCLLINHHLTNNEIVSLNKMAKIIVCPYKSASQSGIVMTTFLFNKPIIASNVGAFKDLIDNNINSILVPPNSYIDLANAINKLYYDDENYQNIVENIEKFGTNNKYSWDDIANKTYQILLKKNI